jgi:hypothetical protein
MKMKTNAQQMDINSNELAELLEDEVVYVSVLENGNIKIVWIEGVVYPQKNEVALKYLGEQNYKIVATLSHLFKNQTVSVDQILDIVL